MRKLLFPFLTLTVFSGCADGGTGGDTANNEPTKDNISVRDLSCQTDLINKANSTDINLIGSKRVDNSIHFRYAVGFDQKPWRCISFDDGENAISQIEHHKHEHKKQKSEDNWDVSDPLSD